MILDPEKAQERLNSPSNLANKLRAFREGAKKQLDGEILHVVKGKHLPRLPDEAKDEIKEKLASGLYKGQDLAREYGVVDATITRVKQDLRKEQLAAKEEAALNSATPTSGTILSHDPTLSSVDQAVKDAAIQKLMLSIGLITEDKLAKMKVKGLASVATSMAKVIGTVAPKQTQAPLVNLVVYSPEIREEKSYKVVEIVSERTEKAS